MNHDRIHEIGNYVGYALAAVALASVVYRQWVLGPNGNIIRWPLAATYRFLAASGKRDYLWTQAGMALLLVAIPVLFSSISIPPGMTLAVLSGILVSLQYLFTPPSVLFLASSAPGIEASFNALRRAAAPHRVVALLSDRQIPDLQLNPMSWDNLRTLDETVWRTAVDDLMRVADVVVVDMRVITPHLRYEFASLLANSCAPKAICVVDENSTAEFRQIVQDSASGHAFQEFHVTTVIPELRKRLGACGKPPV